MHFVTLPPWERYLNWVPDPAPPPTRYHGDLTSPAPTENQENTPPLDASRKLPRRLRPRRRKGKQPGLLANENSASCKAGSATQLGSPANRNSVLPGSSTAWNQQVNKEYPSGASPDLLAPTALTVPQILDQSECRTPI